MGREKGNIGDLFLPIVTDVAAPAGANDPGRGLDHVQPAVVKVAELSGRGLFSAGGTTLRRNRKRQPAGPAPASQH